MQLRRELPDRHVPDVRQSQRNELRQQDITCLLKPADGMATWLSSQETMMQVSTFKAKNRLSALLAEVAPPTRPGSRPYVWRSVSD